MASCKCLRCSQGASWSNCPWIWSTAAMPKGFWVLWRLHDITSGDFHLFLLHWVFTLICHFFWKPVLILTSRILPWPCKSGLCSLPCDPRVFWVSPAYYPSNYVVITEWLTWSSISFLSSVKSGTISFLSISVSPGSSSVPQNVVQLCNKHLLNKCAIGF